MEIKDGNLSRDVWAHGDVSNGNPTAVEAAWAVWRNQNLALEEKHRLWTEIVDTLPDCPFRTNGLYDEANVDSIHAFLGAYMKLENRLLEQFYKQDTDAVYTYRFWCEEERDWIGSDGALYAEFDGALEEFRDDADLDPTFALFAKRYIGKEDRRLYLRMRPDGAVLSIEEANFLDDEDYGIFYDVYFGMRICFEKNEEEDG